uniref:Secreted protein n=1 Tax=Caenorhabditis tropicalis TaxID=1561998 RepID=A0A1I7TH00_9PELO
MSSKIIILLVLCATTIAVDPLDFLFSSNMAQYPRYHPVASSAAVTPEFGKRAPPGCVCTEFLGCHGPGCMRRMYPKA